MTPPIQRRNISEWIGRTIVKAKSIRDGKIIGLAFDDGSFARIGINVGWEAGDQELETDEYPDQDEYALLGIIAPEQYIDFVREKIGIADASQIAAERRQYEELRRKFGENT